MFPGWKQPNVHIFGYGCDKEQIIKNLHFYTDHKKVAMKDRYMERT
jgi:hypoxanthine-guanine phosphoribosyltransferase